MKSLAIFLGFMTVHALFLALCLISAQVDALQMQKLWAFHFRSFLGSFSKVDWIRLSTNACWVSQSLNTANQ